MGALFHNYKVLSELSNKEQNIIKENTMNEGTTFQSNNKPQGKLLFDRTCEKWKGLIYALYKEDGELLLKMISEICYYDVFLSSTINGLDSKSSIKLLFYLGAILQQKLIIKMIRNLERKKTTEKTFTKFM